MHGRLPNATEGAVHARLGASASAYPYDRSKGSRPYLYRRCHVRNRAVAQLKIDTKNNWVPSSRSVIRSVVAVGV